jgi:hypothetical protein
MITHCICYKISFLDILKNNISLDGICNKCRMCNPYIEESIKTGITEFPIDYFKNYDKLKKDELES